MPKQRTDAPAVDLDALANKLSGPKAEGGDQLTEATPAELAGETDEQPEDLDEAARRHEAEVTSTMSSAVRIATQNKALVEQVTAFIVDAIASMRAELDEMEKVAVADGARLKRELDGQVLGAEAIMRQIVDMKKLTGDIRERRSQTAS